MKWKKDRNGINAKPYIYVYIVWSLAEETGSVSVSFRLVGDFIYFLSI